MSVLKTLSLMPLKQYPGRPGWLAWGTGWLARMAGLEARLVGLDARIAGCEARIAGWLGGLAGWPLGLAGTRPLGRMDECRHSKKISLF